MKRFLYTLIAAATVFSAAAQSGKDHKMQLGIKAGVNWSSATGRAEGFRPGNKTGFMVSAFLSPSSRGLGYRTEVVFSRQGFSFEEGGKNTTVMNDYIYLPQLTTLTIARRVQLQLGGQIGFLLNSKKENGSNDNSITGLLNRIDYGFAGGVEVYPLKGLIVGGRYNLGLGKLFKRSYAEANPYPLPFNPEKTDLKNGLVQVFFGYRF